MIQVKNNVFHLNTKNTSHIFHVTRHGDLEHLYYGKRIEFQDDYEAMISKKQLLLVSALYPENDVPYGIDGMCFEYSFSGNGDMRASACSAYAQNTMCRFQYESYTENDIDVSKNPNPSAHDCSCQLTICLKDSLTDAMMYLYYRIFDDCDCITRSCALAAGEKAIHLQKLMSLQLDLDRNDLKAITFNGAWSREREKNELILSNGKFVNDSISGASSARHNPFVMLAQDNADNFIGEAFGFNLIYSGNHKETAEVCPYGKTRFVSGINPSGFDIELAPNECFYTPEAVMTYSNAGYNGISGSMHKFVQNHIVPSHWQSKEKPVLLNSWEAMYFDITEEKILSLAKRAVEVGAELLVVDDGWFGTRNDDTTSLGDWFVNKEKFPDGIRQLSDKLHDMGLKFGLWFEPEMVSKKSKLFEEHPDWALGNLERNPLVLGRSQLVLDLSRAEVQDYIIDSLSRCISEFNIDYIKWDFNRMISDAQSSITPIGAVFHKYVLGFYRILRTVTGKYPNVLFELCASGGARFDLGVLSFMPVGWTSDNTDVISRVMIQEGTSYGYPPSVMCNHISICPNHQTKRSTALESRRSVASFGVLGLQYNLLSCDEKTLNELKFAVSEYKKLRTILNNASFYRLADGFGGNINSWLLVSNEKNIAYLMVFQKLFSPVTSLPKFRLTGLIEDAVYSIGEIGLKASGEMLMNNGLILPQNFQGNETCNGTSNFFDFTAKIYEIKRI